MMAGLHPNFEADFWSASTQIAETNKEKKGCSTQVFFSP